MPVTAQINIDGNAYRLMAPVGNSRAFFREDCKTSLKESIQQFLNAFVRSKYEFPVRLLKDGAFFVTTSNKREFEVLRRHGRFYVFEAETVN